MMLDSEASSPMISDKTYFHTLSLSLSHATPRVLISNGTSLSVFVGVVHTTPTLSQYDVLCILKFDVNLLSSSQLIKNHNYSVILSYLSCVLGPTYQNTNFIRDMNEKASTIWTCLVSL